MGPLIYLYNAEEFDPYLESIRHVVSPGCDTSVKPPNKGIQKIANRFQGICCLLTAV